ncbi:molecular chaperone HtpG [Blattabacterium cuenoti]|uniref:molecular chaperone HtpG n=1 Tax=Blattabacterium cuenoti TaxID=1653831 RepID=UPI00163BE9FB|nr:molecular chaperone HtpG [Blattabacterium cuenoti]
MEENKISVTSENIFPIIKKFLYSNRDIFLRELISNSVDAILKLKTIYNVSKTEEKIDEKLIIKVFLDKEKKTINIVDNGIGMNEKEVKKYINQIAFSGAEEFIQKYENTSSNIIGHFGLGFYSSFMVASKVVMRTQSYKRQYSSIFWSCDGSPKFIMKKISKRNIGTEIILYISDNEENNEFLEYNSILKLLKKYCKFMPVEIYFSSKEKDNNEILINNILPAWKKNPSKLNNKDYTNFYNELYPNQIEVPLFWIHLNIDYPFKLTGILFFPKIEKNLSVQKDKIHLYQNQVYITDNLEGIVPDFLSLLRGVIDSPDIPLNVSRSYLQSDSTIKNISKYITRKVSDRLNFIFKNNILDFKKKWEDIKIIIEYGMISTQDFFDRAIHFYLFTTIEKHYFTLQDFKNKVKESQTNKDDKIIFLYATNKEDQYNSIEEAKNKNYEILFMNSPLSVHLIQKLEISYKEISFVRVDSDHVDNIIHKRNKIYYPSTISEEEENKLRNFIKDNSMFTTIKLENFSENETPFTIVVPEFIRRIKEINNLVYKENKDDESFSKDYQLIVNTNHLLVKKMLQEIIPEKRRIKIFKEVLNLACLSKNLLRGKNLSIFIANKLKDLMNN